LGFYGADYAWYVEMYIGLFLIIPFLNLIYNGLESVKQKRVLIITAIALTALPSVVNIYDLNTPGWWGEPTVSGDYTKLIPQWWTGFYPVTYYFIGCYLYEFPVKLKKVYIFPLLSVSVLFFGWFNIYRTAGVKFLWGAYQDWGSLPNVIITVLTFSLIKAFYLYRLPRAVKSALKFLSDCCLGAYLVSSIFDSLFYPGLITAVEKVSGRMIYFPIMTFAVFFCSLALSAVIEFIYRALSGLAKK